MVREEGHSKAVASRALGVSRYAVGKWVALYDEGGWEALKLGARGRRKGEQAKLSDAQCNKIVDWITDKTPDQLKLPFVLWTSHAVRDLINEKFSIMLPNRTVRKYLKKWGFSAQKPVKQSWQQNPVHIQKWLLETYPEIKQLAKNKGAKIYWVDETGVTNHANNQKGYSKIGDTPVLKQSGPKIRVNMISAVTNRGHLLYMCYTAKMTQLKFILFLSKLVKANDEPIVVITDNLPVHHGKKVAKWVEENVKIDLFFIPSYSPELNADEYLNRDLKKNVNSKRSPKNLKELKANITSFMKSIQKNPERIIKYFHGKHICYAYESI